jgi:hypothetical protein
MNEGTVTTKRGGDDWNKDITNPAKEFIGKILFLIFEGVVCNVEHSSKGLECEVRYFWVEVRSFELGVIKGSKMMLVLLCYSTRDLDLILSLSVCPDTINCLS